MLTLTLARNNKKSVYKAEPFVNLCPCVQLTVLDVFQSVSNDAGVECERDGCLVGIHRVLIQGIDYESK